MSQNFLTLGINGEPIDWDYANRSGNVSALPIDMQFNAGHRLQIGVYSILMVVSAIGNITVLTLLIKRRLKSHTRLDIMLMHLAIADLLVTFLMMPLEVAWAWTVQWVWGGDFMCRFCAFFRTFGLYLSSYVLVCISVDRYFAVLQPLKLSKARGKIMIIGAWMFSTVCSLPQALIFHVEPHPKVDWYWQCVTYNSWNGNYQFIYNILGMIFMYALPLLTIICSYASIYMEIFRHSRMPNSDGFRRSSIDVLGRAKRRTLKMTITIVTVFAICWTPYYVMSVWYWLDASSAYSVDQRVQKGLFLFACTNSCMNPIVYGVYNIKLRKGRNSVNARPGQSSVKLKNTAKYTQHSESVQSATFKHHALKDVDDCAIKIV